VKRTLSTLLLAFCIVLGSSVTTPALADAHKRSRSEAIEIAKERSGDTGDARVLSVEKQENGNGESIFAIKIINNGRVKVYRVPESK